MEPKLELNIEDVIRRVAAEKKAIRDFLSRIEVEPDDSEGAADDDAIKAGRRVRSERVTQLQTMLTSLSTFQDQLQDIISWAGYLDKITADPSPSNDGKSAKATSEETGGRVMGTMFDLTKELAESDLADIGTIIKSAFGLHQSLERALEGIAQQEPTGATVALQECLDQIEGEDSGFGYSYIAGKAVPGRLSKNAIARFVERSIEALDKDEPDYARAKSAVYGLIDRLNDYSETKAGKAGKVRGALMRATGMLSRPNPDMEEIADILKGALRAIEGDDDTPGKKKEKEEGEGRAMPEDRKAMVDAGDFAIKMLHEDTEGAVVGGYMCLWGDPAKKDLQGDYFTPETELWTEAYKSAPALFHHGLDQTVGLAPVGRRMTSLVTDDGLWVEDWIDKSNKYWRLIQPLLKAKSLFFSPGSAAHLVRRESDGRLVSFPIVEDTFTPVPAQHRLMERPIALIKATYEAAGIELPEELNGGGTKSIDEELAELDALLKS